MQSKSESVDSVDTAVQSVATGASGQHKLSLVAQFDDMCRFANSLVTIDEQALIDLVRKCEDNRVAWLATHREMIEWKNKCRQQEEQIKELQANLKHVRFGFGKEVQTREDLLKQRNALRNQLNAIKDFVLSDPTSGHQSQEAREKVLTYLNLNQLETVNEVTNESLDDLDLDYDKTEENVLNGSIAKRFKRKSNDVETNADIRGKYPNKGQLTDLGVSGERLAPRAVFDEPDSPLADDAVPDRCNLHPKNGTDRFGNLFQSSPLMKGKGNFGQTNQSPVYSMSSIDERKHNLHQKKALTSTQCNPCGEKVAFLNNYFVCEDCRITCHYNCKARLPLPCIPFRKPNGKSSQMQLIADFAPQTRPMIPALIYHCCNDIEKRGLYEEGIYRKCGSDKEIRELKEKILKAKSGMPVLIQYDVHVLCGVVKQFLRELDEPIVTRILWRDFVRAADQENESEESALIMQTVEELPTANRDSLAFIMIHLNKVVKAAGNQMDSRGLSKIFGPTIVGHSMIDPPMPEILAENPKQIKVMEALFRIPEEFWSGFLTATNSWDNNTHSPASRSTLPNGRSMGTINRGALTPMRNTGKSKGGLTLRPLF